MKVPTYYLELRSLVEFTPSGTEVPDLEIREARIASPELGRFLYTAVGRTWHWSDRLSWPYSKWWAHLERPEVEVWIGYMVGGIACYVELERPAQESVGTRHLWLRRTF